MKNSKYIGDELSLFKEATNWKNYWYHSIKNYISGDVLEVGAGMGINTNLFLQEGNHVKSILAVEPDIELSNQILENVKPHNSKVEVHTGFLTDLRATQKFDTIVYIDVIEHIEKDGEELSRAMSHLNEGGHLIILVPAYNYLFSPFDEAVGHFRRYDKKMLKNSIPDDLNEVKLFYLDSLGACASAVNKFFLKQSYPTVSQILKWDKLIVPTSKIVDKVVFNSVGKSLIGIWGR
jgi:SAM-dependent methyltransferase